MKILIIFCMLGFAPFQAGAESIVPTRHEAKILPNGQLSINTRFQIILPDVLIDALRAGASLNFTLNYQLEKPTLISYRSKLSQWVNEETVNYRLSFHPITGRYRISVGTYTSEYHSLDSALKGIGAIANWHVLDEGTLRKIKPNHVKATVRLNLSTSSLPKPFQINALTERNWQLDSGWKELHIQ